MKPKILCLLLTILLLFPHTSTIFAQPDNTSSISGTENISDTNDTEDTSKPSDTSDVADTSDNSDTSNTSDTLTLSCESAILMDATTGAILYEKDASTKQFPASITKLMTLLLAYENGSLDDTITFSHDAIFSIEFGSSHIAIQEGETLTLEQVLYGIMLQSANECSNGVAEYVDGDIETFAKHMTERAKELGCKNTNFVNANGLHDENHYTTAYDMALIAQALLQIDAYREMMGNTYYEIPPTNKQTETRYLHGQHQMLNPNSLYYYETAEGGKTGYTSEALNTLVTYAKQGDTELIAVVLRCNGAQHYVDTKTLFDYGFSHYKTEKVLSAGDLAQTVSITETYKNKTEEKAQISAAIPKDIYITLPIGANPADVTTQVTCEPTASVPIAAGDALGSVALSYQGETIDTVSLTAQDSVAVTTDEERAAQSAQKRNHILKIIGIFIGVLLLCGLGVILFFRYRIYRKKELRRQRRKSARKLRLQQYEQQHLHHKK